METCTDDNVFAITSFLLPRDLFNLALVCKCFGWKNASSTKSTKSRQGWPWSMMEEASRRRVSAAKNDKDNPWRGSDLITIRGEESWMAVGYRLYLLQSSLIFSKIIGSAISHVNDDMTHVQCKRRETVGFSVAICQKVMTAGKHCTQFTITQRGGIYMGIIRSSIHGWPKKRIKHEDFRVYCRSQSDPGYVGNVDQYYYYDERNKLKNGDVFGMLLDLDQGTMTVYKNGECLGVKVRGLAGHYCWAVTMNKNGHNIPSVYIRPGSMKKEI